MERCAVCGSVRRAAERGACVRCGEALARPDLLEPARRGGAVGEFLTGLDLALRGARLTLRPRLLSLVAVPFVLNLLIFVLLVYLVLRNRDLLSPEFAGPWPFGFDWLRAAIAGAAVFLGVLIGILLAVGGTLLLSSVVNAPFLEFLSEAVESLVFGQGDATPVTLHYVWNVWIVPVLQALALALVQAALALGFLLLSLTAVLSPLVFVGGVWLTAVTLADVVIARKRYPVAARFAVVGRALPLWFGLALPFVLVPFLLPFGVAGATLAWLRERNRDLLRPLQ